MKNEKKEPMGLGQKIRDMSTKAQLEGRYISVLDVRYNTAGIPVEVTDQYVFFAEAIEVLETGKYGGKPVKWERVAPGGRLVMLSAVIRVDYIERE